MKVDKSKRVPIYLQCAEVLKEAIAKGKYKAGEFLPSERELSQEFGINRLTLRKGLAELVRCGQLENVPGAGNRILSADNQAASTRNIGCVMLRRVGMPALSPYFADIFEGIESETAARDYQLLFSSVKDEDVWDSNGRPKSNPRISDAPMDGVLLIGGLTDELALAYHRKGVQVVVVDRQVSSRGISTIVPDNMSGAYDATYHLTELGHKRIAFLGVPDDPVCDARMAGFKRALDDAGVAFKKTDFISGDYAISAGLDAMKSYLASRKSDLPTALFAVSDEAAIGAIKALQEKGLRVPDDMSVIGFDDITWSTHLEPPLTTVKIQREEMGRWAARTVISQVESAEISPTKMTLQTELVVRGSSSAPRN